MSRPVSIAIQISIAMPISIAMQSNELRRRCYNDGRAAIAIPGRPARYNERKPRCRCGLANCDSRASAAMLQHDACRSHGHPGQHNVTPGTSMIPSSSLGASWRGVSFRASVSARPVSMHARVRSGFGLHCEYAGGPDDIRQTDGTTEAPGATLCCLGCPWVRHASCFSTAAGARASQWLSPQRHHELRVAQR